MQPRVAVIGLGTMGAPIADRLLSAGFPLTVWNRDAAKAADLGRRGAAVAATAAEAAAASDIVLSVLFDDAALEAVTLGPAGIAEGLPAGGIHVSCSTVSPALADRLEERHAGLGQHLVGAPLLGSAAMAASGALYLAASGPAEAIDRLSPVFAAMAQKTVVVGARARHAAAAKLANNFLMFSITQALAEAQAFADRSGLGHEALMNLLWDIDLGRRVFAVYGRKVLERNLDPAPAPARLAAKDIGLTLAEASRGGAEMPLARLALERLETLMESGWGDLEFAALTLLADRESGLSVAPWDERTA